MGKIKPPILGVAIIIFCVAAGLMLMKGQTTYTPTMPASGIPDVVAGPGITIGGSWPSYTVTANQGTLMTATSASIGGGLLLLGGCNTTDVTVSGATTGMVAIASPSTSLANGVQWQAAVISANTVRVYECALLTVTPASTTFQVRVIP